MRTSLRGSQICLTVVLVVLASCSSTATELSQVPAPEATPTTAVTPTSAPALQPSATEPPASVSPTEAPTVVAEPGITETPATPTATPAPRTSPTSVGDDNVPIQLWYPKDPESYEDGSMRSVDRFLYPATHRDFQQRITAVLDWWAFGPNASEVSQGFLDPLASYTRRGCGLVPFKLEFVGQNVIVELCGPFRSAGVGEDARVLESFRQTLAAAGVNQAALLYDGGDRCLGNQNGDNPLSCLDGEIADAVGAGFRCPDAGSEQATIIGVDEWVNARVGPSLTAAVGRRFDRELPVTVYPSTMRTTGDGFYWVAASTSDEDRCLYVAARFLETSAGRLDRVLVGISYDLPTTGEWSFRTQPGVFGQTSWSFEGDFITLVAISITVTEGARIDEYIADQERTFDEFDYDVPEVWFEEIEVPGADRAIRPVTIVSGSGDVVTEQLRIEVGGHTILAQSDVYIEDVIDAPLDEMRAFIDSITIDRATFLAALDS